MNSKIGRTRDVGGQLRPCGCCENTAALETQSEVPFVRRPASSIAEFSPLWRPVRELAVLDSIEPLLASWEKSTHPSQVRMREYRQRVREQFGSHLTCDHLYIDLRVGLSRPQQLLNGNDLENYLTPLFECGCLPTQTFRLIRAEKVVGGPSRLAIGIAEPIKIVPELAACSHLSIPTATKPTSDAEWKNSIRLALISSEIQSLPDGEAEVHIAWKCALGRRSWFRMWKPVGDAMGPILGSYERKNEFDPKDDRITKLRFYFI